MTPERQSLLTEKGLLHESKENAISIRGVMNPYCMQIMTCLCFLDRTDLGAMRVRTQKGDMSLAKVTAVCAKQLGAFLKRSPPVSSTMKLSRTEYERACSKTFAACTKRLGTPESKKKDGSEPPHASDTSPDKSTLARKSSFIHGQSSTPSATLQIQPLQQVPLSKDALGKRKSWEESSDEDSNDGKLIFPSSTLTFPKTPLGFAHAAPQAKPSPSSFAPGSSLGEGSKNDLPPVALSSAAFKFLGTTAHTQALDVTLVGARSPNIFPNTAGVVTSVSALSGGSDTCPTNKHGSEGKRPTSASRKNHFLEDAFRGDSETTGNPSHPIDASQAIKLETAPVPQRSEAANAVGGQSSGVDAFPASAAVGTSLGEVIIMSPKTMNNFDSPNTFLEQLTSSTVQTSIFLPSDLSEDVDDGLISRSSMPQLPELRLTMLASDSLVVSSLAGGDSRCFCYCVSRDRSNWQSRGTARVYVDCIIGVDGRDSYVCASAARREYATTIQNSSKMAEQAAMLEEERTGRRVAEVNRDVVADNSTK
ncbi:uncharacterized protein LOC133814157 [Humulus lupulus]|uniref:uncharacterized protein LOC133814157 n=1 Tax=Humulus lupulus TaxID=3486 RepID=UPI002B4153AE|nr:uncharacterized protein LOC133814157 [Humulus lupulus]